METPVPAARCARLADLRRSLAVAGLLAIFSLALRSPARAMSIGSEFVVGGLNQPLFATAAPGDKDRLFILEKTGRIRILDLNTETIKGTDFLSLVGQVSTNSERGLLGLAFHPNYQSNGLFYVNFTDLAGTSTVRRYQVSANPDVANAGSAQPVLTISQPAANHNGGWMDFGPDGNLYISVGDGGGGNDPSNNGQNTNTLLGSMLRIDVNSDDFPGDPNLNYAIPAGNPFAGGGGAPEIWAYGLRNPWRNSFDRDTGDLYIADVGQNAREEVNFQLAASTGGENYGWRLREGTIATPSVGGPPPPGNVDPIYDYLHGGGSDQGNSVTGGYVYRGPVPALQGKYFFGDFINSRIWSIEVVGGAATNFTDWTATLVPDVGTINSIASFGEDDAGNLYIVDFGGEIFRLTGPIPPPIPEPSSLCLWTLLLALAALGRRTITRRNATDRLPLAQ